MDQPHHEPTPSYWKSPAGLAWVVAALVGGFYLLAEHRAHLYGFLPFLALGACPLMHLFMHRGHHRDGRHRHRDLDQGELHGGSNDQRNR